MHKKHATSARVFRGKAAYFTFHAKTFAREVSARSSAFSALKYAPGAAGHLTLAGSGGTRRRGHPSSGRALPPPPVGSWSEPSVNERLVGPAFPIPEENKLLLQRALAREG